jgi:hypothetical protein
LSTAEIRNRSGIDRPAGPSTSIARIAATTMNRAFRIFRPAITRERWSGAERACTSAYSGTM